MISRYNIICCTVCSAAILAAEAAIMSRRRCKEMAVTANYVLFDFESTAEFPAELDRRYRITEGVIRSLIIKKEDE